jgi:N-carbamoyl-L-amino-acid hydrolase
MSLPSNLPIDANRLWDSLAEMAKIGATAKGGSCRLALSDEDKAGRDLFVSWCEAAGCTVSVDRIGNIFARRKGGDDSLLRTLPPGVEPAFDGMVIEV